MPFPATFPKVLTFDASLGAALTAAIAEAQLTFPATALSSRSATSIAAIDESTTPPSFKHAGLRDKETHYSASLLKVAAMYAAFQLRQSADNFAQSSSDSTPAALFANMSATFDPLIKVAVQLISDDPHISSSMKVPKYQSIFAGIPLIGGGFSVRFGASFLGSMRNMIIPGDNNAAATCVQQLGYSWLNGTLEHGGFFDRSTKQGIWLCGTFTGALPIVQIPSKNDGLVAQATTCFDMANLYALMFQKTQFVDPLSCDEMLAILRETQQGPEPSWMTRSGIAAPGSEFKVTHTKIGLGGLKPENGGFEVVSEGAIVEHVPTGKKFITVWQNVRNDTHSHKAVSLTIDRTIKRFLGVP
jgi:hypothetical protein